MLYYRPITCIGDVLDYKLARQKEIAKGLKKGPR
jgi:hypothetical protein